MGQGVEYEIVEMASRPTAVVRGRVPVADLPGFFVEAYRQLFEVLERDGVAWVEPALAYYPTEPGDVVDVEAGVVVEESIAPDGAVSASTLPGGPAAVAIHVGPYEKIGDTYRAVMAAMARDGVALRPAGVWEEYLTDPDSEPDPSRWRTRLVIPVAV